MPCTLTPIIDRQFPGHCTAGAQVEFPDEAAARAYAHANKISEFMISYNAKPIASGERFNIATL